jgi:hypothetical protein
MPAAKGGLKGVRRNLARDKATMLVAQAVREDWGVTKFAKEAGVSTNVACDVLAEASRQVKNKADRELGVLAGKMRDEAHTTLPVAVALNRRALAACERVLECLERDIDRYGDAGIPGKNGETPASVVLARAAQTLAGAVSQLGGSIKDLTGMKAAETVAVKKAIEAGKRDGEVDPWAVDFEVVDV